MLSRWSVGAYGALVNVNEMVPEPQTYPDGTEIPQAFEISPVYDADWSNLGLNWAILGVHAGGLFSDRPLATQTQRHPLTISTQRPSP